MRLEIPKIVYRCQDCGEIARRKSTEPKPRLCPYCKGGNIEAVNTEIAHVGLPADND